MAIITQMIEFRKRVEFQRHAANYTQQHTLLCLQGAFLPPLAHSALILGAAGVGLQLNTL